MEIVKSRKLESSKKLLCLLDGPIFLGIARLTLSTHSQFGLTVSCLSLCIKDCDAEVFWGKTGLSEQWVERSESATRSFISSSNNFLPRRRQKRFREIGSNPNMGETKTEPSIGTVLVAQVVDHRTMV